MRKFKLIRAGGVAAVLAGMLRGLASVAPATTARIMLLYLLIDVLLFFASIGLYAFVRDEIRLAGGLGVLLEVFAALILIARDLRILADSIYPLGALMFALGLDLFAIGSWRLKKFPRWALLVLIVSTLIGPIGFFVQGLEVLFLASGLLFGIGLVGAGMTILLRRGAVDDA